MLRTSSEALSEVQPLQHHAGDALIVFAGRIGNREELKGALALNGCCCETDTDVEVVLNS